MSGNVFFSNTKLRLSGKKGILKPDSEGYFEFPIGAFNCMNSAGEVYTNDNIDDIFSSSGVFMRKIQQGKLFGEWGHPMPRESETPNAYLARASNVDDKETCVFFKDVWNDKSAGKHFTQYPGITSDTIITFARLKPHGSKWEALQRAIEDPNVNIAFSVRNMGRDRVYRGKTYVSIEQIITWDAVTEQGVASSEKYGSMRLEHNRVNITPRVLDNMRHALSKGSIRMENADGVRAIIASAERLLGINSYSEPIYTGWK